MAEIVVGSAVRCPIGSYGGALKDVPLGERAATVVREAVRRAGVAAERVGHTVFGNVIHTEPRDMYLARVASVNGGLPVETPALTLNRLCGSGLQAILTAASHLQLGETDCAVAGGGQGIAAPYERLGGQVERMARAAGCGACHALRNPRARVGSCAAAPRATSPVVRGRRLPSRNGQVRPVG